MLRSFLPSALTIVLFSCTRATTVVAPPEAKPVAYHRQIIDHSPGGKELASAPVADLPAVVDVVYRVRPDRRFVNAAADIVEIMAGRAIDSVDIDFTSAEWNVRVEGKPAIALSELATFRDALSKLTEWAVRQPGDRAKFDAAELQAIDADIARFYPRFLFAALHRLDRGKPLEAAASARAAHAAALLCAQKEDRFDLADPLRARAVALLAIAKSLDANCCRDSEAIMAQDFGYDLEAQKIAAELPKGFAREWVVPEDPGPNRDAAEEWLMIMRRLGRERLLASDDKETFSATIDIEATPVVCENSAVDNAWPSGALVQSLMLKSMRRNPPATVTFDENTAWQAEMGQFTPTAAQREFDRALPAFANAGVTRFLDRRSILSFYEANWYAAARQQFSVYYDHLGDVPGAKAFSASLQPSTASGRSVAEWMINLVDAQYGRFEGTRVSPALQSAELLGGEARYLLFDAITRSTGDITGDVHRGARDLFRTLDARPAEVLAAGKLANYPIGHIARRDVYLKSAIDRAPRRFEGERAEYLGAIGDREALRRLAADRSAAMGDRVDALCHLKQFTDVDLHSDFEHVFAEQNYSLDWLSCYWTYLNKRKQPVLKERFARKVLEKRPDLDAISRAWVTSALGNALEAQGRYAEAWKLVEPHVPVYSANILLTATSLLQRLGRNDEALKLGRETIERYPDADTMSDFAEVLWRMGRDDEAGELFDPARHAYAITLAQEQVPVSFLDTFADAEVSHAIAAYDAMIKHGAPAVLLDTIVGHAYLRKRWAFGLALNDRYLTVPAMSSDVGMKIRAYAESYEAMKTVRGETAFQWFLAAFPQSNQDVLINLLNGGQYDLLAAYAAARPPRANPLECSAIIAAALAMQHVPVNDPRWNVVRQMLPSSVAEEGRTIQTSVRYLLHDVDAAAVTQSAVSPNNRSEAMYFLGVRAVSDGEFDRALPYFVAAAEGPANYPTRSWSVTRLYVWRAKQRSWQDIAREQLL